MIHQKHQSYNLCSLDKHKKRKKNYNLKKVHFEKKDERVKKYLILSLHDYLL